MSKRPEPHDERPAAFIEFVKRFPKLGQAWDLLREGEADSGPLDEKARRLIKVAVAVAREAEGATHSAVRKARRAGATKTELEQVVALAASTMGLPNAVKIHRWVVEACD